MPSHSSLRPNRWFFAAVVALFIAACALRISGNSRDPAQTAEFFDGDSMHYVQIAERFSSGDFSMHYVAEGRAHRMPLYPLLITPAIVLAGRSVMAVGLTNLLVAVTGLLVLHWFILRIYRDNFAASCAAALFALNQFTRGETSDRAMTEPLYVTLEIAFLGLFLSYLARRRLPTLLGLAAIGSLCYLTRPNGLFLLTGGTLICGLADVLRHFRRQPSESSPDPLPRRAHLILSYIGAATLIFLLTLPAWLPRLIYKHNPLDQEYLTNFLWADSYAQAHDSKQRFTVHDFLAHATHAGVTRRWLNGLLETCVVIPFKSLDKALLTLPALAGILIAFRKRLAPERCLFLLLVLCMLPLAWSFQANPSRRIAYGVLFPFSLYLASLALSQLPQVASLRRRSQIRVGPKSGPP